MAAIELPASLSWARPNDALLLRICRTKYAKDEPSFRATGTGRFDDPDCKFGTLYCAADFHTCYAETLLRETAFNIATRQYEVSKTEHDARSLTVVVADLLNMRLVDLFGEGISAMGLNSAIGLSAYDITQALATALFHHGEQPHGIVYRSRFGPHDKPAIVFFDRARAHLRLFPGAKTTPLNKLRETFDALTQTRNVALL